MKIEKYVASELAEVNNEGLLNQIAKFIQDTFKDIEGIYPTDDKFPLLVNDSGELRNSLSQNQQTFLYIYKNAEQEILACLWGHRNDHYKSFKWGPSHLFFVTYIAVDKLHRKSGLGGLLLERLEEEAIETSKLSQRISLLVGIVLEKNDLSITRNTRRNHNGQPATIPGFIQYSKRINPPVLSYYSVRRPPRRRRFI